MTSLDLPEELRAMAERELGETPEKRSKALTELRQLIAASKGPQPHRTDDAFLVMYLRHAKFDAKKAHSRLQATERWMQANAELLGDWRQYRAADFMHMVNIGFMGGVDGRAKDGSTVLMIKPMELKQGDLPDPSVYLKWAVWTLHRAASNPHVQVGGQLIIETFQGMSFLQAMQFGRGIIPQPILKQQMAFMSQCAPFRLRGIWLFHQGLTLSILMAITRPFLSRKMKERIQAFGGDYSKLHELVDPTKLPPEFGGTCTDEGRGWFNTMVEAEQRELQQQQQPASA